TIKGILKLMRYIGLDLGTKTLGVAVSDMTGTIASAITTLRFSENNPSEIMDDLTKIIDEYKVGAIVIGLPKNMNNSLGFAAERTKSFVKILNDTYDIPVYEQDERLSSVSANNVLLQADISRKKRKSKVDMVMATIILQNYLDIRKGKIMENKEITQDNTFTIVMMKEKKLNVKYYLLRRRKLRKLYSIYR
ncbi:MAG: Holliday junction resolvase RuvX, partial [Intestinibacter sp.]